MKGVQPSLLLLLLLAASEAADLPVPAMSPRSSQAEAGIRAVLDSQVAAWNRGDLEGFMRGYWKSDRTAFVGSSGIFRGWQALLERYRRTYPDRAAMGRLAFSDVEITVLAPDGVLVFGRWELERASDHPGGVFTLVARKFPEGWRIIHDHTSTIAPSLKP